MVKMEIELTEAQMEKVEILKSKDVSVGEAIDLLFEVQNEIVAQIEEQNPESNIFEKMDDSSFDSKIKAKLLKKNFDESETYDMAVQDTKHKFKWSKFF